MKIIKRIRGQSFTLNLTSPFVVLSAQEEEAKVEEAAQVSS
jgi:hypothetical protein